LKKLSQLIEIETQAGNLAKNGAVSSENPLLPQKEHSSLVERLRYSKKQALLKVSKRFRPAAPVSKELSFKDLPEKDQVTIKPAIILACLLCILMPFAMKTLWPSMMISIKGVDQPVAAWSIILWLVTLSFAWSALLVGAAASNRPAFLIISLFFIYFFSSTSGSTLPPAMAPDATYRPAGRKASR